MYLLWFEVSVEAWESPLREIHDVEWSTPVRIGGLPIGITCIFGEALWNKAYLQFDDKTQQSYRSA